MTWAFACVGLSGGECGDEEVSADGAFSERKSAPIWGLVLDYDIVPGDCPFCHLRVCLCRKNMT